jgi:uncharacterized protein
MGVRIADTGFIVALKSEIESERRWARAELQKSGGPFLTCEGAIIEAAHFLSPAFVARLLQDGDLQIAFNLMEQIRPVLALLEKYKDQKIDATDACVVRMSEIFPDCKVFTVDHDFDVYRRFGRDLIPTSYPKQD